MGAVDRGPLADGLAFKVPGLGQIEVAGFIGKGGMGYVYDVFAKRMFVRERLALKLHMPMAVTPDRWRALEQMVRRPPVKHPNLCYPLGTGIAPNGWHFHVMRNESAMADVSDLLDGRVCKRTGKLAPRIYHAVLVGEQMCDAFMAMHRADPPVTFADINPGNCKFSEETCATRLLDCENMRRMSEDVDYALYHPDFGAPELMITTLGGSVVRNSPVTDAFSLAKILYRMLVLDDPFHGRLVEEYARRTGEQRNEVLYGLGPERRGPVFQFSQRDQRNAPLRSETIEYWRELPALARAAFHEDFTCGVWDPEKRHHAGAWREVMSYLRTCLAACHHCGEVRLVDAAEALAVGGWVHCRWCGNSWKPPIKRSSSGTASLKRRLV